MTLENYQHYLQDYLSLLRRSFKKDILKIEKCQKLLSCVENTVKLEWYIEHFKNVKELKISPEQLQEFLTKKCVFTYHKIGIIGEDPYEIIDILPFSTNDNIFLKQLNTDIKKIEEVYKMMKQDEKRSKIFKSYIKNKEKTKIKEIIEK